MNMTTSRSGRNARVRTSALARARATTVPDLARQTGTAATPPAAEEVLPHPARSKSRASDRPAVVVDRVGIAAVRMAGRIPVGEVPRRVAQRRVPRTALDKTERALLAFVNGENSVGAIVTMVGEPSERVIAAIFHLERLGIIDF